MHAYETRIRPKMNHRRARVWIGILWEWMGSNEGLTHLSEEDKKSLSLRAEWLHPWDRIRTRRSVVASRHRPLRRRFRKRASAVYNLAGCRPSTEGGGSDMGTHPHAGYLAVNCWAFLRASDGQEEERQEREHIRQRSIQTILGMFNLIPPDFVQVVHCVGREWRRVSIDAKRNNGYVPCLMTSL